MTTHEFTNVEALRQQCMKIRQLAADALSAAVQRRDVVLNEVRHEEQRLAALSVERRMAEESLNGIHDEVERLMCELQLLGAEFAAPREVPATPAAMAAVTQMTPVTPAAVSAKPQPSGVEESLDTVQDEMERLTRELEMLGAELAPPSAWAGSEASGRGTSEFARPAAAMPLSRSQ